MKANIIGKKLVIEIPIQQPKLSSSGKNKVVSTTRGIWESAIEIDGRPLKIILNAFIDSDPAATEEGDSGDDVKPMARTKRRK